MRATGGLEFYGPVHAAASQCDYWTYPGGCPWVMYQAYVGDWAGLTELDEFDIVVNATAGGGRLYFDYVDYVSCGVVSTERSTWGRIKSLYR
jgi:hypothetical protein